MSGLIVVQTPDATLVAHQDRVDGIKTLVARVAESAPEFV